MEYSRNRESIVGYSLTNGVSVITGTRFIRWVYQQPWICEVSKMDGLWFLVNPFQIPSTSIMTRGFSSCVKNHPETSVSEWSRMYWLEKRGISKTEIPCSLRGWLLSVPLWTWYTKIGNFYELYKCYLLVWKTSNPLILQGYTGFLTPWLIRT